MKISESGLRCMLTPLFRAAAHWGSPVDPGLMSLFNVVLCPCVVCGEKLDCPFTSGVVRKRMVLKIANLAPRHLEQQ